MKEGKPWLKIGGRNVKFSCHTLQSILEFIQMIPKDAPNKLTRFLDSSLLVVGKSTTITTWQLVDV
jgi:hypothetical protein